MTQTRHDGPQHPGWCSPGICHERFPDIHHRHLPEMFVPRGEAAERADPERPAVTWALEQDDEVDEQGKQVIHAPVVALGVGPSLVRLSLDEAAVLGAQLIAMTAGSDSDRCNVPSDAAWSSYQPEQLVLGVARALANRSSGV